MGSEVLKLKLNRLKLDSKLQKIKDKAGFSVQSLLFPKGEFNIASAKKWASSHGFKSSKVDVPETGQFIRLRQKDPKKFKTFRTISLGDKVKATVATNKSRFVGTMVLKSLSKFSGHEIQSAKDIELPLRVEISFICEGETRDGFISRRDIEESLDLWEDIPIIDWHDMDDETTATTHKISDRKGYLGKPRLEIKEDGKLWIVSPAEIIDENIAFQLFLKEKKNKPLQISPEFGYVPYFMDGKRFQTNINPHLICIVDEGHIIGNQIKIES